MLQQPKPVEWVGTAREDLKAFPKPVRRHVGQALFAAQLGEEYPTVKALQGFGGRSVLEIVVAQDKNAYRAVYTVRFEDVLFVLHVFQKKSKKGVETLKRDVDLIRQRLKIAEQEYRKRLN
jgi:phage-related protein